MFNFTVFYVAVLLKGLVTQSNFHRELWGNQLQSMLTDYFDNTWVIFQTMFTIPKKNMWKLKSECLFFLETAWNWLPVNCLVWHGPNTIEDAENKPSNDWQMTLYVLKNNCTGTAISMKFLHQSSRGHTSSHSFPNDLGQNDSVQHASMQLFIH